MRTEYCAKLGVALLGWNLAACQDLQNKILKKPGTESTTDQNRGDQDSSVDDKARYAAIAAELDVNFESREIKSLSAIEGLASQKTSIVPSLLDQFCIHAYKLSFRSDFREELGYFCDEHNKPKALFSDLDRYTKITKDTPTSVEIFHKIDGDYSTSVVAVAYEIPIPPKFVKEAGIPYYMVSAAKFPYFEQTGKVVNRDDGRLGGDLQFSKFDLYYETINRTSDGKIFKNEKTTEFNGYQVQGGNSDIGLGTEHLVGENTDYKYFKTITITIGTDTGGSIMINFANVTVKHNGYHKNARDSASDIGIAQGHHVRNGVLQELPDRVIK